MGFHISTYQHDRPTHYSHPTPPDRRTTIGLVVPRWVCFLLAVVRLVSKSLPHDPIFHLDYIIVAVAHVNYLYFTNQIMWGGITVPEIECLSTQEMTAYDSRIHQCITNVGFSNVDQGLMFWVATAERALI